MSRAAQHLSGSRQQPKQAALTHPLVPLAVPLQAQAVDGTLRGEAEEDSGASWARRSMLKRSGTPTAHCPLPSAHG